MEKIIVIETKWECSACGDMPITTTPILDKTRIIALEAPIKCDCGSKNIKFKDIKKSEYTKDKGDKNE